MDEAGEVAYGRFAALREERAIPPVFERLWVAGSLDALRRPAVALVGTRAATGYGKALAHRFAAELGAAGCCIISGLALGIDSAAHRGALEAGAPTIGVLGSGHRRFFPQRNRALAQQMLENGGAVLSPYPPEQRAYPSQFLERNGVVAALADAVVVIEAPVRSGALNTAGWAAGRIPVLAVPGDVDRAHAAGCHALIRDGATLARDADDVLEELGLGRTLRGTRRPRRQASEGADPLQRALLQALGQGERSLDELVDASAEPAHRVLAALSMLDLAGAVEIRPGQRYSLR